MVMQLQCRGGSIRACLSSRGWERDVNAGKSNMGHAIHWVAHLMSSQYHRRMLA